MAQAPLFRQPLGPSKHGRWNRGLWNVSSSGTTRAVTCDLCGTNHPESDDDSYSLFWLFDRQGVEQCCGAVLDEIYRVGAEEFATAYIHEYTENPGDARFSIFAKTLKDKLKSATEKAKDTASTIAGALEGALNLP